MAKSDPYTETPEFAERTAYSVAGEIHDTKKAAAAAVKQANEDAHAAAIEQRDALAAQLGLPEDLLRDPVVPEIEIEEVTVRTVYDIVNTAGEVEAIEIGHVPEPIANAELERLEAQAADPDYGWRDTADNDPDDDARTPRPTFSIRSHELIIAREEA